MTMFPDVEIPYGAYWSTPFVRWQGALAHLHSVRLAAHVAKAELGRRGIAPGVFDLGVLGLTVVQRQSFYGLPWLMSMIGADGVGGPTVNQVCATGVRCLQAACEGIAGGAATAALVVTADRTSNGPHVYYPNPLGPGGAGETENVVLDNMASDPNTGRSMLDTAENVARKWGIGRDEQHAVVLARYAQYQDALAGDRAFLRRFMTLPMAVPDGAFRKTVGEVAADEGVYPTTPEKLDRLRPVVDGGTVTHGSQTHPADGNAAVIVAAAGPARGLSALPEIRIGVLGFGMARAAKGLMPAALVPAAHQALERAGIGIGRIDAFKSHNPFAVNDIVFARETGVGIERINNFGCSLIWGHPQGPTGLRSIIELIEELALRGGGLGLFTGCAAGDTGMAVVLEVGDRRPAARNRAAAAS